MMTSENNLKTLISPEEAVQTYIGEQFLEWLLDYITQEVKSWNELKQFESAQIKSEKLKKLITQRYLAAEAFMGAKEGDPGFLGFAVANLSESSDPLAENALGILEQKRDEEWSGGSSEDSPGHNTHHKLWIRLLKALDVSTDEINKAEAKDMTRNYIAELSDLYSNSEWQTAMGAFLAHERSIPQEYAALSKLIKQNTSLSDADLEVLTWHAGVDVKYVFNTSHMLEKIVVDEEGKQWVWDGVSRQLEARKEFYNGLLKYLEA